MRFTLPVFVLAVAVGLASADAPKKIADETKKADDKTTPEAKFAALQKRYIETVNKFQKDMQAAKSQDEAKKINDEFQPKHEKMAAEALALAKASPTAEFAFEAVSLALQDDTTDKAAVELIGAAFADDKRVLDLLPMLGGRPDAAGLMDKLAASKSKEVRGGVSLPRLTGEIERLEGSAAGKPAAELEKAFAAVAAQLAAAVKEYGDVQVMGDEGPQTVAEAAKAVTYMLENLRVGKPLADVDCPTLDANKPTAKISDYRGKVVVLDIWATWCGPCRAMIPHEREMVKKLAGKPFALISVSADDEKETLTKFLDKTEMPWTHWHAGARGELLKKYQVKFFPTVFVLDAKGVIRHKNIRDKELEAAVEELVKEAEKK